MNVPSQTFLTHFSSFPSVLTVKVSAKNPSKIWNEATTIHQATSSCSNLVESLPFDPHNDVKWSLHWMNDSLNTIFIQMQQSNTYGRYKIGDTWVYKAEGWLHILRMKCFLCHLSMVCTVCWPTDSNGPEPQQSTGITLWSFDNCSKTRLNCEVVLWRSFLYVGHDFSLYMDQTVQMALVGVKMSE